MNHKLTETYLASVRKLEQSHPPAHRFLSRLQHEGPEHGLWLSTATNAHLYKYGGFLMYIKPRPPSSLILSAAFNQNIAADTGDQSELVFRPVLRPLVMKYRGFSEGWAPKRSDGAIELTSSAPEAFFDELFVVLRDLNVA